MKTRKWKWRWPWRRKASGRGADEWRVVREPNEADARIYVNGALVGNVVRFEMRVEPRSFPTGQFEVFGCGVDMAIPADQFTLIPAGCIGCEKWGVSRCPEEDDDEDAE